MKSQTEALEHASVRQYCKAVRMPAIAANFLALAEQALQENHSHIRYLEALLPWERYELIAVDEVRYVAAHQCKSARGPLPPAFSVRRHNRRQGLRAGDPGRY